MLVYQRVNTGQICSGQNNVATAAAAHLRSYLQCWHLGATSQSINEAVAMFINFHSKI